MVIAGPEYRDGVLPTDTTQPCKGALGRCTRWPLIHWSYFV